MTEFVEGTFLGLPEGDEAVDVAILSVPYELTTSYGQGTSNGPKATIEASAQVELYDPLLPEDLPCGFSLHTAQPWDGEGDSLEEQLSGITEYVSRFSSTFPVILGGEHGMLPAIMKAVGSKINLNELTMVQIDAHADLRDELDGDPNSHACAVRRSLELGVGEILQIGIRAFAREEAVFAAKEEKVGLAVGVTDKLTNKYDAVKFAKLGSEIIGGKGGGGRKDFAQAGGQDASKIEEAFDKLKSLV